MRLGKPLSLLIALVSLFALGACSQPTEPLTGGHGSDNGPYVGHVHGLGVDPADGVLYVAAHGGVFRVVGGNLDLVAARNQDTMGFTVVGPRHFLASGHPAPTELDRPSHLGLIESRDAAETWTEKSLFGQADFHSLAPSPGGLYAYDSITATVMRTSDYTTWTSIMTGEVHDLAAHPTQPDQVLATTRRGVVRLVDKTPAAVATPALFAFLDRPSAGVLVGATVDGAVYRSPDGGTTWAATGQVPGQIEALATGPTSWHAATDQGIFTTSDQGKNWVRVL
jgi:hypothetical protein